MPTRRFVPVLAHLCLQFAAPAPALLATGLTRLAAVGATAVVEIPVGAETVDLSGKFVTPGFYRYVRHPLYVGWFIVFWASPEMSAAHLFFAVMTTAYILIAVRLEERDLENELPQYRTYKAQVPRFIPRVAYRTKPALGATA